MANDKIIILDEDEEEVQFLGTGKLNHDHIYATIRLRLNAASICFNTYVFNRSRLDFSWISATLFPTPLSVHFQPSSSRFQWNTN